MPHNSSAHLANSYRPNRAGPPLSLASAVCAILLAGFAASPSNAQDDPLPTATGEVKLTITGNLQRTNSDGNALLDDAILNTLPRRNLETTTSVTDGVMHFEGFLMRDLLDLVGAEGDTVTASALNDYIIDIPMTDFHRFDVLVATHMNDAPLLPSDKGPFWIVYPRDDHDVLQDIRYDYRWVWQLIRLDVE